jgi:FtsH-binding integral membrane protein
LISVILSSIAWFITCYNPTARRSPQIKWWLLGIFTLGEATLVGFLSSFYKFSTVVSAMWSTALATGAITLYTLMNTNPKYDLSQWGSNLTSIGLIFIVYGIIHLCEHFGLLPHGFLPYNDKIMGFIGASLFSAYMAYHTRLVMSGKHSRYQLNEQDYVFGAMTLYSDIVNVFLYILKFLGEDSHSDDH